MHRLKLSVLLFLFLSALPVQAQYFPADGREALHQRALDAKSRLNVLSIALQPGYEDLATLAYFRMAMGARIVSAYVTNGEAGESDLRGDYPNQLAAVRRAEAAKAIALLGGEEYFLNMPDLGAVRDTSVVLDIWRGDTLRPRLTKLLTDLKPDVILIARNWADQAATPELIALREELLRAIRRLLPERDKNKPGTSEDFFGWTVNRVLMETGSKRGLKVPVDRVHPLWKKSYRALGDEAGRFYESCSVQRRSWYGSPESPALISYEEIAPTRLRALKSVVDALPTAAPPRLRGIDAAISELGKSMTGGAPSAATRAQGQRTVAALLDSVDALLSQPLQLNSQGRKIAMQWKLSLENLRVALLGIKVRFTLDPIILTTRQLALLKIESVTGTEKGDSLWAYFPAVEQGWIVDEHSIRMVALRTGEPYRLLSPNSLENDLPGAFDGLTRMTRGKSFTFFIMGKGKSRERNFIYRGTVRTLFAPKFAVEVLTPIVRAMSSERVVVRLTNYSRDGVRDSIYVSDSLAVSAKEEFRINQKDQSEVDALSLKWKGPPAEGTYLVPISIGGQTVAHFAARAFQAAVDTTISVAVLTGMADNVVTESLNRLGVRSTVVRDVQQLPDALAQCRVAIVDRRAFTLLRGSSAAIPVLRDFAQRGGHVIVLAQDAAVWNAAPLMDGLLLTPTNSWGEATALQHDQAHPLFSGPNEIGAKDWDDWYYRRAHNVLSGPALESARNLVATSEGRSPMVLEWTVGTGVLTYVDLALHPQLLNIHPGAFRLLANLISY